MKINPERLKHRLETLSQIGRGTDGGITRLALTPDDLLARKMLSEMMAEAGLSVSTDAAGNILGRRAGVREGSPALLLGSHIDTVPNGGMFDGALGVLAAVECAQALADQGVETIHPVEVIAFTDEEGARFHRGLLGSKAFMGESLAAWRGAVDAQGTPFIEALRNAGLEYDRLHEACRDPASILAFLEIHIEQGQVLESLGRQIGIVEGIVGIARVRVVFRGMANHAGTTPMRFRKDALLCAAELALAVESIAHDEGDEVVGTVGIMEVYPGSANVIPGTAVLTVEFRTTDADALGRCKEASVAQAQVIADRRGVSVAVEDLVWTAPVPLDAHVRGTLHEACQAVGVQGHAMPSGAGHDAMVMARYVPTGMVFVPSRGGISHNPQEWSDWDDVALAANVMYEAIIRLAGRS